MMHPLSTGVCKKHSVGKSDIFIWWLLCKYDLRLWQLNVIIGCSLLSKNEKSDILILQQRCFPHWIYFEELVGENTHYFLWILHTHQSYHAKKNFLQLSWLWWLMPIISTIQE
jgi:hypothetical protein